MNEMFLLKLGEIVLKGGNRFQFENRLKTNVARRMRPFGDFRVSIVQSTVYVEPENADCDLDGAWEACHAIFGVVSLCRCRPCAKDLDAIFDTAMAYLGDDLSMAKSFKVESRRSDKRFPLTSIGLSQEIGGRLAEAFPDVTVDVHHPDYTVYVEVRDRAAYVHGPAEPGAGGLPTGVGGRAMLLLSGGIDSPVAGYMIAKRGVELECVHFFSYPYTSELAKDKVLELARLMTHDREHRRLYGNSGGHPRQLPGGILYAGHAPVHDEDRRAHRARPRLRLPCHRREPWPGRLADHGGHGRDGRLCGPAHLPAAHRHG